CDKVDPDPTVPFITDNTDTDGDVVCYKEDPDPKDPCKPDNTDTDGDGICDKKDPNPTDPCIPDNTDTDGDGICDKEDPDPIDPCIPDHTDVDNDGICDSVDPEISECLKIYNEFTPNGDGMNDRFVITCIKDEKYKNNHLEIYNRWGNLVYSKDRYDNSWDGKSNVNMRIQTEKDLPAGTYFYVLNLGDGSKPRIGWVYINKR
ncbi:MAG: gliding motility-associated C-terminal domain-containing protein, partial [Tenacibaculum sp.]